MYSNLLKKIINETFASDDMKVYLRENVKVLDKVDIVNIVRKSPISLRRKGELFEALCEYEDKKELEAEIAIARESGSVFDEDYIKERSYHYQMEFIQKALSVLESAAKDTGILLLQEWQTDNGTEALIGDLPFFSYEKCISFIKNYLEEYPNEPNAEKYLWHIIEKYDEDMTGELNLSYTYYLFDGEIIYYEDANSDYDSDVFGGDLYLPAPFKPGDIITCDAGPTGGETRAVILRAGDNRDCCSLVSLIKRENGILDYGIVKHTNSFYDFHSRVMVPPLFSAQIVAEEIVEKEIELKRIQEFINCDEDRGYIVEMECSMLYSSNVTDEFISKLEKAYKEWIRSRSLKA